MTDLTAAEQLRHIIETDNWGDPALINTLARSILAERDQLAAAIERTTDRMRDYGDLGPSATVNVRQVLGLLSPTWPDGNYTTPPQNGPQRGAGDAEAQQRADG